MDNVINNNNNNNNKCICSLTSFDILTIVGYVHCLLHLCVYLANKFPI